MPKQISETIITGNIDDLVFYKMDGKGYLRRKSSLTKKQFKTQQRFANSRKSAERFSVANKVASEVYKALPDDMRNYALFCQLKTNAIRLLKKGDAIDTVKASLQQISSSVSI